MGKPLFRLKDVRYSYLGKFPALCGIDLEIYTGQRIAVIGANGSGKSTLLHMLDGLVFPDSGSVEYEGMELKERSFLEEGFNRNFRRRIGLVFQDADVQLFCPSVREELLFGPLQFDLKRDDIASALDSITKTLGVEGLLERMPHQLSVGEKKKVAIASVLMSSPDVILLDEPTAGLDPKTSRHLIGRINEMASGGRTIITSTQDMHIVPEIADRIIVMGQSRRIVRDEDADSILNDRAFLEEHNLVHIHAHKHKGLMHTHPHDHHEHIH